MPRIEVRLKPHLPDARGQGLAKDIADLAIKTVMAVRVVDIYWLDADLTPEHLDLIGRNLLADPLTQEYRCFSSSTDGGESLAASLPVSEWAGNTDGKETRIVEVAYNPGVTDPVEGTVIKAVGDMGVEGVRAVKTAKRYLLQGKLIQDELETICSRLLVNPIVQHVVEPGQPVFPQNPRYDFHLNRVAMLNADEAALLQVRQEFGFSEAEVQAIVAYFSRQGRDPTDAEMETLAQTWSERPADKGKVMPKIIAQLKGRADGREINAIVTELLTE